MKTLARVQWLIWLMFGLCACGHAVDVNNTDQRLESLRLHFNEWKGVPHRLGGMNKQGVDCSGFAQLTYAQLFDIILPRSTQAQSNFGDEIPFEQVQTGDLVFFDIVGQDKYHHVGIYLNDGQFMHASTTQGVVISDFENDYWHSQFWKVIRPAPYNKQGLK